MRHPLVGHRLDTNPRHPDLRSVVPDPGIHRLTHLGIGGLNRKDELTVVPKPTGEIDNHPQTSPASTEAQPIRHPPPVILKSERGARHRYTDPTRIRSWSVIPCLHAKGIAPRDGFIVVMTHSVDTMRSKCSRVGPATRAVRSHDAHSSGPTSSCVTRHKWFDLQCHRQDHAPPGVSRSARRWRPGPHQSDDVSQVASPTRSCIVLPETQQGGIELRCALGIQVRPRRSRDNLSL